MSEDSLPMTRLTQSQRQLSIVSAQVNARQREAKLEDLTLEQLKGLNDGTRMFMQESYDKVVESLQEKQRAALEESEMLQKKQSYLVKDVNEAQSHLNDLVRSIEHANSAQ